MRSVRLVLSTAADFSLWRSLISCASTWTVELGKGKHCMGHSEHTMGHPPQSMHTLSAYCQNQHIHIAGRHADRNSPNARSPASVSEVWYQVLHQRDLPALLGVCPHGPAAWPDPSHLAFFGLLLEAFPPPACPHNKLNMTVSTPDDNTEASEMIFQRSLS